MRLLAPVIIALLFTGTAGAGPGNGPILFLARAPQAPVTAPAHLYSIRADGSERRQLSQLVTVGPVLSPDGTKIAFFLTDGGSPRDLYVMNSDGTAPRLLRSYPEYENSGTGLRDVTWSPDGSRLAYLLPTFANGEQLRIVDVGSGAEVLVAPDGMPKAQLAWSPDGSELAFASFGSTNSVGIYAKNVTTGAVRIIVPTAGALYPKWSPDGTAIAYIAGGIWIAPREGGSAREVGHPVVTPAYTSPPLWSPDGKTLYFNEATSIGAPYFRGIPTVYSALFAANADGSGQRQLRPAVSPIGWSPEGDALVVGGRDGVFFTRPDGKCITFVAEGLFVAWRPGGNPPRPFECVDLVARVSAPVLAGRVGVSLVVAVTNAGSRPAGGVLTERFSSSGAVIPLAYDKRACMISHRDARSLEFSCELGRLAPGEQRELRFRIRGPRGLLAAGSDVKTGARDSDPTSNVASAYVRVHRCWLLGREVQGDVLRGTSRGELICGLSGNDRLFGAGGSDTLDGGYGSDVLVPGSGRDAVAGGYGDDRVSARDGERDTIDCGRGDDMVTADTVDVVARNCEHVPSP